MVNVTEEIKNPKERMIGVKQSEAQELYPHVRFFGDVAIKFGVLIGAGTGIGEWTVISNNAKIGKRCIILYHVTICKDAVIGNDVFIGPNTTLLNDMFPPSKTSMPPIIKDGVIIGGGVIIRPSVTIGRRAVITAGANVTKDVPDEEVWMGNPAKYYCTRQEYEIKKKKWNEKWKK
jgi:acetyltransferase-like isoleucine patch superfamily enzyme